MEQHGISCLIPFSHKNQINDLLMFLGCFLVPFPDITPGQDPDSHMLIKNMSQHIAKVKIGTSLCQKSVEPVIQ